MPCRATAPAHRSHDGCGVVDGSHPAQDAVLQLCKSLALAQPAPSGSGGEGSTGNHWFDAINSEGKHGTADARSTHRHHTHMRTCHTATTHAACSSDAAPADLQPVSGSTATDPTTIMSTVTRSSRPSGLPYLTTPAAGERSECEHRCVSKWCWHSEASPRRACSANPRNAS